MTTAQIIIITILAILALLGFSGNLLSKKEGARIAWSFLLLFTTSLFALIAFTMTSDREKLSKQIKDKCPQYEKVENVYRLKETQ